MLTPEQCEQAARDGERPVLEWKRGQSQYTLAAFCAGSDVRIYIPGNEADGGGWDAYFGVGTPSNRAGCRDHFFRSLVAAQLYAESLLRDATAPLHAAEIAALKAQRDALDRKLSDCDKLFDGDPESEDLETNIIALKQDLERARNERNAIKNETEREWMAKVADLKAALADRIEVFEQKWLNTCLCEMEKMPIPGVREFAARFKGSPVAEFFADCSVIMRNAVAEARAKAFGDAEQVAEKVAAEYKAKAENDDRTGWKRCAAANEEKSYAAKDVAMRIAALAQPSPAGTPSAEGEG